MEDVEQLDDGGILGVTWATGTDAAVIALAGELDYTSARRAPERLAEMMAERAGPYELDLARVSFIDSSGLALLLRLTAQDPTLRLVNASPAVRRIVLLSGLGADLPLGD